MLSRIHLRLIITFTFMPSSFFIGLLLHVTSKFTTIGCLLSALDIIS